MSSTQPSASGVFQPAEFPRRSAQIRRVIRGLLLLLLLTSVAGWYFTRDTVPERIRIATGPAGGYYHKVGELLGPALAGSTGKKIELVTTAGSVENVQLLNSRVAELAILQDGSSLPAGVAVVAPLYADVIHVLVRRSCHITSIDGLRGRRVSLGPEGSGMRESALTVVQHYGITADELPDNHRYFGDLANDATLEGAIVTTSYLNSDLRGLIASGEFEILPIGDSQALCIHHPYLSATTIPKGVYDGSPTLPAESVATVCTTAFLATRKEMSGKVVRRALAAIYEQDLKRDLPTLYSLAEARQRTAMSLHPAARSYQDPFAGIDVLSNLLESISAVKELLFALGAGMFLVWNRWQRLRDREERAAVRVLKDRLDELLEQTVRIEQAQIDADDPRRLRTLLDDVTRIKLRAIRELTHESLRGDRMFSIFLLQCGDLAVKIQAKLAERLLTDRHSGGTGPALEPPSDQRPFAEPAP